MAPPSPACNGYIVPHPAARHRPGLGVQRPVPLLAWCYCQSGPRFKQELVNVEVAGAEAGLRVGEVEMPHPLEGGAESELPDIGGGGEEAGPPSADPGQLGSGRFWHDRRPRSEYRLPWTREAGPDVTRQLWESIAERVPA